MSNLFSIDNALRWLSAVALGWPCAGDRPFAEPLDAASIVARHVDAVGGRERLAAITSLQAVSILDERGTLHPMFIDRRRPNQLRLRMMHGGELTYTEVYTGTTNWEGAPGKENCHTSAAASAAVRRAAEQFDDALISAASNAAQMRYVGLQHMGGRELHRVDIAERGGSQGSYFVDAETFMLTRIRNSRALHPGEPVKVIEVVLGDFRPVGDVLMPFRSIERDVATGEPLTSSIALWIEANVPITDDAYALPSACK